MEDKDLVQQNSGAQQGNVHQDSDTGTNEKGHPGSTLHKGNEAQTTEDPAAGGKENEKDSVEKPDTLGNP